MTSTLLRVFATIALAVAPGVADAAARMRTSEQIAIEWRETRHRELIAERNAIDARIAALNDDDTTPDTPPPRSAAYTSSGMIASEAKSNDFQRSGTGISGGVGSDSTATKTTKPNPEDAPPTAEAIAKAIKALDKKPGGTFGGIDFGGGISFTLDIGTSDRISDAALVDGIVRVNDENNGRARIMLESHYFFTPWQDVGWLDLKNKQAEKQWGWGPFIALQPGTDDVIEAVGMGVMFGARRGAGDDSFNLGFGFVVDPNTRILGEGLTVNKPLPAGETAIRYKEEMQTGFLILSSFSF